MKEVFDNHIWRIMAKKYVDIFWYINIGFYFCSLTLVDLVWLLFHFFMVYFFMVLVYPFFNQHFTVLLYIIYCMHYFIYIIICIILLITCFIFISLNSPFNCCLTHFILWKLSYKVWLIDWQTDLNISLLSSDKGLKV